MKNKSLKGNLKFTFSLMTKSIILLIFLSINLSCNLIYGQNSFVFNGTTYQNNSGSVYIAGNDANLYVNTTLVGISYKPEFKSSGDNILSTAFGISKKGQLSGSISIYEVPNGADYLTFINNLSNRNEVNHVFIDYLLPFMTETRDYPNDPLSPYGWWIGEYVYDLENYPLEECEDLENEFDGSVVCYLNLRNAWNYTTGSSKVKVGILDTGTDWTQSDMPQDNHLGRNFIGEDPDNTNPIPTNNPIEPYHPHGTQMMSILCSKSNNAYQIFGIAGGWPGEGDGVTPVHLVNGPINDIGVSLLKTAEAIEWAVDNRDVRLFNMSFGAHGIPENDKIPLIEAIDYAINTNEAIFVAAAGQMANATDKSLIFPANYEPVIAITGANQDHQRINGESMSAFYGSQLDFISTFYSYANTGIYTYDNQQVQVEQGTSCSSMTITGVIALMLSVNPCLTSQEVYEILKNSCHKATNHYTFNANGWNENVGYGFPNARKAVKAAIMRDSRTLLNNEEWTGTKHIIGQISIPANKTLTINNCVVDFNHEGGLIVEPGGKLIINGSTLTTTCNDNQWIGIQVWGDRTQSQVPYGINQYHQGYLEINNNSTIENAICAVDLWKPGDWSATGGILKATTTNFINNTRSIHALSYRNMKPNTNIELGYAGYCTNCTFSIDAGYLNEKTFYKHVDIADINGFNFIACDFSVAKNITGVSTNCAAISSYSAKFTVTGKCNQSNVSPCPANLLIPSTFTGFYKAIDVTNPFDKLRTFTVKNGLFNDNVQGISVVAQKNQTIINSNFNVGYNPYINSCGVHESFGINMNTSNGFAIEENTFKKYIGSPAAYYTGINTVLTEAMDDIYKNDFDGLSFGNKAFKMNRSPDLAIYGLEFLCNTNQNNYADFYVPLWDVMENGIQSHQGSYELSAGNTFSQYNNTWHFYNGGGYDIVYFWNGNTQEPTQSKINVRVGKAPAQATNTCPSHYGGINPSLPIILSTELKALREAQFATAWSYYTNVKTLHDQLQDGGSTTNTLNDIETAQPEDMWALRTQLLGASPHLTTEVLKKVVDRTDVFPQVAIFEILAANPDELRRIDLIEYIENAANPLPDYMIEILQQVAGGLTYRTVLENQMTQYRKEMVRAANDMIRTYLNEDEVDYNQVRNWLDNLGGLDADRQIISTYLTEGNIEGAQQLAAMLPSLYNLQGDELTANNDLIQILDLYESLETDNRYMDELTAGEKTMLYNISDNGNDAAAIAQSILTAFDNASFDDCTQYTENAKKRKPIDPADLAIAYGMSIEANPNPANEWVTFVYTLPENEATALLQITDVTGKTILSAEVNGTRGQKLIDTRPMNAGTYLYTLKAGKFILNGKLTVIK